MLEGGARGVRSLDERTARFLFRRLAEGVDHMHRNDMFHRDLKLENIVLTEDYRPKIMDFGPVAWE